MSTKPVLGIMLGDAAGVGPEIVAKVTTSGFLSEHCNPILVGDLRVFQRALDVIEQVCKEQGCPLYVGEKTQAELVTADLDHMVFTYREETYTIHLAGSHQLENAVLALAGIRALQEYSEELIRGMPPFDPGQKQGMPVRAKVTLPITYQLN